MKYWLSIVIALAGGCVANAQVMNSKIAATSNTEWLSKSLADGKPIKIPVGTLYVNGTAATRPVVGCGRLESEGSSGYSMDPHPTLSGFQSRIVQLGKGPILRLSGVGFIATDPIEFVGDGESAALEIEGRAAPATGRHRFRNLIFRDWGCAFKCLAGYYRDGKFIANENHADNSVVEGCETFNVDTLFRSENQQSLNWVFRDCAVNGAGVSKGCVVADVVRGGCLTLERLVVEESKVTIFRVTDYSPNNSRLVCRDLFYDQMLDKDQYLCLFEYAGPAAAANYARWSVFMDGFVAPQKFPLDRSKFYQAPADLPRDGWRIEMIGVEKPVAAVNTAAP